MMCPGVNVQPDMLQAMLRVLRLNKGGLICVQF